MNNVIIVKYKRLPAQTAGEVNCVSFLFGLGHHGRAPSEDINTVLCVVLLPIWLNSLLDVIAVMRKYKARINTEIVLDLFAMGHTTAQISRELGHSLESIQKHLLKARAAGDPTAFFKRTIVRKRGPNPNKHWTEEADAKLRELARQGLSSTEIAPILGVTTLDPFVTSDASAETAVSRAGQTATSSHCRLPQGHTAQVSYAVKPWLDAATMRILAFQ
jgi:hypothetical protein